MANREQVSGKGDELKGNIKEGVGKLVGNERMQGEGEADKMKGKAKQSAGDLKDAGRKAADNLKEGIHQATE